MEQESKPEKFKITQMISADGWYGVFFRTDEPHLELRNLAAFVLIQETDGNTTVDGVDGNMMLCLGSRSDHTRTPEIYPYFSRFVHHTQITEEAKAEWVQKWVKNAKQRFQS